MIIQCDLGSVTGDLIACARYRIYDLRAKADAEQRTHVLFIIHLTHQAVGSFIGFQGDPWVSYHIDDLSTNTENTVSASEAIGLSLVELFRGQSGPIANNADEEEENKDKKEGSGDKEEESEDEEEGAGLEHEENVEEEDTETANLESKCNNISVTVMFSCHRKG